MLRLLQCTAASLRSAGSRTPLVRSAIVQPWRGLHTAAAASSSLAPRAPLPASPPSHGTSCRCCSSSGARAATPTRAFSTFEAVPPSPAAPSTDAIQLNEPVATSTAAAVGVAVDPNARFIVLYTCKVCETRSAKSVSRQAYTEGVVLIRCDGCQKLHLFADHLKWFDDQAIDIETIMREKGTEARWTNSLELTQEQLDAVGKLQVDMAAKAAKAAELKKKQEHDDAAAAARLKATAEATPATASKQKE